MDSIEKSFVCCAELLRLQTEDTVNFIRPGQTVAHKIQLPASQVRNLLSSLHSRLAFSQSILCPPALANLLSELFIGPTKIGCAIGYTFLQFLIDGFEL